MANKIKLTNEEMRQIALFESITGATAKDCVIDTKNNRLIFVVKEGDLKKAVGRRGSNVKLLKKMTGRDVEVVEYADNPIDFVKNTLAPARVREVRIADRSDGRRIAFVVVEPRDKGVAIGRGGRTAERARHLAKRYFQIDNVVIS